MSLKVLLMAMSMAAGSTFGIVAQSAAVVDVLKEGPFSPSQTERLAPCYCLILSIKKLSTA